MTLRCVYIFSNDRRLVGWLRVFTFVVQFVGILDISIGQYGCFAGILTFTQKANENKIHERGYLFRCGFITNPSTDTNLNTRSLAIKDDHK